jgi:glutamine synthetase
MSRDLLPAKAVTQMADWLKERAITEVECMIPDLSGVARGKILPTAKFMSGISSGTLKLPESVLAQTVAGDVVDSEVVDEIEPDFVMVPDPNTLRIVPWYDEPTAQVICDAVRPNGELIQVAPRSVLKRVLAAFHEKGWEPIVAPEVEFYLVQRNLDPDLPLLPPHGRNGRPETTRQSYGIDAVNEFDPIFEDVYDYCAAQQLDIDTLIHEGGAAQCEINFNHGDPLALADQAFLFKRTVRQAALKHGIYATFMAKPYADDAGSAMHIHQSVLDKKSGENIFTDSKGKETKLFNYYIGGLQKYMPAAMPLFAPNVNSYRRLVRNWSAPINTHWGRENRTVGLRVPESDPENRRVENRVPGSDVNPYLAIAGTLACGYLGMTARIKATEETERSAYSYTRQALPRHILEALAKFKAAPALRNMLGTDFSTLLMEVKSAEHDAYQKVISAWEREHLLLNV